MMRRQLTWKHKFFGIKIQNHCSPESFVVQKKWKTPEYIKTIHMVYIYYIYILYVYIIQ